MLAFLAGEGWGKARGIFGNCAFSLEIMNGKVFVKERNRLREMRKHPASVFDELLSRGYWGVGYLGYEFFKYLKSGFPPSSGKDGSIGPEAAVMFFESREKASELLEGDGRDFGRCGELVPNLSRGEFIGMVKRVKEYIAAGDVYQVNLSQRLDFTIKSDPTAIFRRFYQVQPVPYGCYLDFGRWKLLSGSMELFLRKSGRKIVTRPIKGTREKRGAELLRSEKERAENLMIVDLMRNDLGRVCEFGSIRVNDLFKVEKYNTLYQMVSEVEGKLREEASFWDTLEATFPPGSVTGAPKRRAMEIINELEPHLRGPYCGAIGVLEPNGDFTLSVAIRVMGMNGMRGSIWVGGGITWGSIPRMEYEETLLKGRAAMMALGIK
ncbi:MAG: anthranilate synthase component I family protein [Candidatus Hadarchaeales archaeon]